MLLQQLHFHSLPGHEFLGIPPPPQQDKDEAHPANSNNSGTKPPSFYNFPIPVQEFREKPGNGAFPAVSPLPTSKGIIPRDS